MKTLIKASAILLTLLLTNSYAHVKGIDVDELVLLKKKSIKVIDIRDNKIVKETGIIPGSFRLELKNDVDNKKYKKWLHSFINIVDSKRLKFVLISQDGVKSKNVANLLHNRKRYKTPYYLKGGFDAWKDKGMKIKTIK